MPKGKRFSGQFKFKVALEAAKGAKTLAELSSEFGLHPSQISEWKGRLMAEGANLFVSTTAQQQREQENLQTELYEQIGRLQMELEWLKKKLPSDVSAQRALIDADALLSIRRQCDIVGLNRSTFYDQPAGESDLNLHLMRLIDEQYLKTPFYGWPRMTAFLRQRGYPVNGKRVRRLMRVMDLQAIYPKQRTTVRSREHIVYPYLLRNVVVARPNQVWSADITYIPMVHGFMYLVAIIDWCSRYVVAWELSNTLDGMFCLTALERALQQRQPEIFNSDQGVQFTSLANAGRLQVGQANRRQTALRRGRQRCFTGTLLEGALKEVAAVGQGVEGDIQVGVYDYRYHGAIICYGAGGVNVAGRGQWWVVVIPTLLCLR